MTSLATLIGLIPMAAKLGTGSEAYAPLARAIIGGLAVSVVLTVFIVPAGFGVSIFPGFGFQIADSFHPRQAVLLRLCRAWSLLAVKFLYPGIKEA